LFDLLGARYHRQEEDRLNLLDWVDVAADDLDPARAARAVLDYQSGYQGPALSGPLHDLSILSANSLEPPRPDRRRAGVVPFPFQPSSLPWRVPHMNSIRTHASHGADSSVASRALPVAFAALLGVFLIFGVGFSMSVRSTMRLMTCATRTPSPAIER